MHERVVFALGLLFGGIEVGAGIQPIADLTVGWFFDDGRHVARRHRQQLDLLLVQSNDEPAVSRPREHAPRH